MKVPGSHSPALARGSGFTLVELMVTVTLVTFALVGMTALYLVSVRGNEDTLDHLRAVQALQSVAETIRSSPFDAIVANYTGAMFPVDEIGGVCTVQFHLDETDTSAAAASFGLPRDLNGDGDATDVDVSTTYSLLPIRLVVTWNPGEGDRTKELEFLFSG